MPIAAVGDVVVVPVVVDEFRHCRDLPGITDGNVVLSAVCMYRDVGP
jgi:hypothetical protein